MTSLCSLYPLLSNSSEKVLEPLFDHNEILFTERNVKVPSDIKTRSNARPELSETGASSPSGALGCIGRSCLVPRHSGEIML